VDKKTGLNPADRSRPGSKHHILVEANGVPVNTILTGANRNDVTQLLPLVNATAPIRGVRGRPLRKPKSFPPIAATTPNHIAENFVNAASSR